MEINFNGKTALVTGAGRGIGRQTVKKLIAAGANVIAVSKTASNLTSLIQEVSNIFNLNNNDNDNDHSNNNNKCLQLVKYSYYLILFSILH